MNLYLRLLKLLLFLPFVPERGLFDASRAYFRVWPNDCDINLHMNNGRYLTFMDLGRVHLLAQMRLLGEVLRRGWRPVVTAAEISYVRALDPFQRFALVTRLLSWDEKYFYIEQRFERGDTLCATALVKGLFLSRQGRITPAQALAALGLDAQAPPLPDLVQHWNDLGVLKREQSARNGL